MLAADLDPAFSEDAIHSDVDSSGTCSAIRISAMQFCQLNQPPSLVVLLQQPSLAVLLKPEEEHGSTLDSRFRPQWPRDILGLRHMAGAGCWPGCSFQRIPQPHDDGATTCPGASVHKDKFVDCWSRPFRISYFPPTLKLSIAMSAWQRTVAPPLGVLTAILQL